MIKKTIKILYVRTSTVVQNTDRQLINAKDYNQVIEDKVSGTIPFFNRPGGEAIKRLVEKNVTFTLYVHSIDRLGRDLLDILNTIQYFTTNKIPIVFITQGLTTLIDGKENIITTMLIGLLGTIAQMGRAQIKEAQMQGIEVAKLKNAYKGRANGTKEDRLKFLSKYQKEVELYRNGYPATHINRVTGTSLNTLTKIKRFLSTDRV